MQVFSGFYSIFISLQTGLVRLLNLWIYSYVSVLALYRVSNTKAVLKQLTTCVITTSMLRIYNSSWEKLHAIYAEINAKELGFILF